MYILENFRIFLIVHVHCFWKGDAIINVFQVQHMMARICFILMSKLMTIPSSSYAKDDPQVHHMLAMSFKFTMVTKDILNTC